MCVLIVLRMCTTHGTPRVVHMRVPIWHVRERMHWRDGRHGVRPCLRELSDQAVANGPS